jgi:hypothetical protein
LGVAFLLVACGDIERHSVPAAPQVQVSWQATKLFHFAWADVDDETEYRLLEDPDGDGPASYVQVATIQAGALAYDLRVFLPAKVNASYVLQACNGEGCTDSAPVSVFGHLSQAVGYVKASNASAEFGAAVALSADGSTLAVGAPGERSNADGIDGDQANHSLRDAGAVYVFVRRANAWSQQAYVKASNSDTNDRFGSRIALSADGRTMVVAATGEGSAATGIDGDQNDNTSFGEGAVYVFSRGGGVWRQQAYVKASNRYGRKKFGTAIALSSDGNTLAVGAPGEAGGSTGVDGDQSWTRDYWESGAAYLFTRLGSTWTQTAYVKASNTGGGLSAPYDPDEESGIYGDWFGYALALSGDGNTLVVGAPLEDGGAGGIGGDQGDDVDAINSGAVYVFVRSGGIWRQQSYVKESHPASDDGFGLALTLARDGNTLAVLGGRQVHFFARTESSWREDEASLSQGGGRALSLSSDGRTFVMGNTSDSWNRHGINDDSHTFYSPHSGAVLVYSRSGSTWAQQAYVKASNTEKEDYFGTALALSADGETLAIGAVGEDSQATGINGDQDDHSGVDYGGPSYGAVYLY